MKLQRFSHQVKIFKALAHETRMLVVDELSRGERCVCELTELAGIDISTMSKHLSVLREAGIVDSEKRGMQVYYQLLTPWTPWTPKILFYYFACWQNMQIL